MCWLWTYATTAAENSLIQHLNLDCVTHGWKLQEDHIFLEACCMCTLQ